MSVLGGLGLFILVAFIFLMIALALVERRWRRASAHPRLRRARGATERAVEAGSECISRRTGTLLGGEAGPALAGLSTLTRVADAATMSDRPPWSRRPTARWSSWHRTPSAVLPQSLRHRRYHANSGRLVGATPWRTPPASPRLNDEDASVH